MPQLENGVICWETWRLFTWAQFKNTKIPILPFIMSLYLHSFSPFCYFPIFRPQITAFLQVSLLEQNPGRFPRARLLRRTLTATPAVIQFPEFQSLMNCHLSSRELLPSGRWVCIILTQSAHLSLHCLAAVHTIISPWGRKKKSFFFFACHTFSTPNDRRA